MRRAMLVALIGVSVVLTGCGPSGPSVGDLSGSVYVTMKSGDVKRAAGVQVHLVAATDQLRSAWTDAVTRFQTVYKDTEQAEVAARAETKHGEDLVKSATSRDEISAAFDRKIKAITDITKAKVKRIDLVEGLFTSAVELIKQQRFQLAQTDVNGHYDFTGVQFGEYYLFVHYTVFKYEVFWMAPVSVNIRRQTLNLSNTNVEVLANLDEASD
jgi:hypothetical protein